MSTPTPKREPADDRRLPSRGALREESAPRQEVVRLVPSSRSRSEQALASLVSHGLKSDVPSMVDELFASEKRANSLLALIPFFGPLFISMSERHTDEEKRRLTVLSIGLTIAIFALIWALQPSPATQVATLHSRIESEMLVLRNVVEQYRTQHGSYPSPATWKRFTEQPDARFFDPWGRPYRFDVRDGAVVLQTLGQDGLEGGSGRDADVTTEQRSAPENVAALSSADS